MTGRATRPALLALAGLVMAAVAIGLYLSRGGDVAGAALGTNTRLGESQDVTRARGAIGLTVNPDDPAHVVAVDTDLLTGQCQARVSFDSAQTWEATTLTTPVAFEGCEGLDTGGYHHSNGSVAFGSDQTVYTTFSSASTPGDDAILLARSDDGGRSYGEAAIAIPGAPGSAWNQRPTLAVLPRASGDRLWIVAWECKPDETCTTLTSAVSDDSGASWSDPVRVNPPGDLALEVSQPTVGADGEGYLAYRRRARIDDVNGDLMFVRRFVADGDSGQWEQVGVLSIPGVRQPRLVTGPEGEFYVAYFLTTFPPEGGEGDFDVRVQRTDDNGETWSRPIRINRDRDLNGVDQTLPWISVAPSGRIDVVWYDARDAYPGTDELDVYYAFSDDGGVTFSPNQRVTDRSINPGVGLDLEVGTYQHYNPVVVAINDGQALIAWPDSREGNLNTNSQDVYLARVRPSDSPDTPPPVSLRQLPPPEGNGPAIAALSAQISQLAYPGGAEAFNHAVVSRVVIVSADDPGSALAGSVLARAVQGPVLIADRDGLSEAVRDEIRRLGPAGAYLVGSDAGLGEGVVDALIDAGIDEDEIARLGSADAADTAAQVARTLADLRLAALRAQAQRNDTTPPDLPRPFVAAVIADPATTAAGAGAAFASAVGLPYLFVEDGELPGATRTAIANLEINRVFVLGGPDAIPQSLLDALPDPARLTGPDAVAVSAAVADQAAEIGLATNVLYVTDNADPVHNAILAAAAGRVGGQVLIVNDGDPNAVVARVNALRLGPGPKTVYIVSGAN